LQEATFFQKIQHNPIHFRGFFGHQTHDDMGRIRKIISLHSNKLIQTHTGNWTRRIL